jgi:hypothetical protein
MGAITKHAFSATSRNLRFRRGNDRTKLDLLATEKPGNAGGLLPVGVVFVWQFALGEVLIEPNLHLLNVSNVHHLPLRISLGVEHEQHRMSTTHPVDVRLARHLVAVHDEGHEVLVLHRLEQSAVDVRVDRTFDASIYLVKGNVRLSVTPSGDDLSFFVGHPQIITLRRITGRHAASFHYESGGHTISSLVAIA